MKLITFPLCDTCNKIIDVPGTGFVFTGGIRDAVHHQSTEPYLFGSKQAKIAVHKQCFANQFKLECDVSEGSTTNDIDDEFNFN